MSYILSMRPNLRFPVQDVFNRPIASAPGAWIDMMERTPPQGDRYVWHFCHKLSCLREAAPAFAFGCALQRYVISSNSHCFALSAAVSIQDSRFLNPTFWSAQ